MSINKLIFSHLIRLCCIWNSLVFYCIPSSHFNFLFLIISLVTFFNSSRQLIDTELQLDGTGLDFRLHRAALRLFYLQLFSTVFCIVDVIISCRAQGRLIISKWSSVETVKESWIAIISFFLFCSNSLKLLREIFCKQPFTSLQLCSSECFWEFVSNLGHNKGSRWIYFRLWCNGFCFNFVASSKRVHLNKFACNY